MITLRSLSFAALLALSAAAAHADATAAARRCVSIADRDARLSCFDAAFAAPAASATAVAPAAAVAAPAGAAAPGSSASNGDTATFGDVGQLPAERAAKAKIPRIMTAKVAAIVNRPNDLYRLTLDNGQVWDTNQSDWAVTYRVGDSVTIQRMALGGYQLSPAASGRSVGAKRIQ